MKKQIDFPELENSQLDREIKKTMEREFPLPENVENAQKAAFAQIKRQQEEGTQAYANRAAAKMKKKIRHGRKVARLCGGIVAAAAAFSGVCIVNPAFAAQIPLVGHVFEELGESLGFSGDFSKYAKPVEDIQIVYEDSEVTGTDTKPDTNAGDTGNEDCSYSQTKNGMTVTLSEVYCNDEALYVSLVLHSEDEFPETMNFQDSDTPLINLMRSTMKFSFDDQEKLLDMSSVDGKMIDDHTYAGVVRYDLSFVKNSSRDEAFEKAYYDFIEEQGVTKEEIENSPEETEARLKEILGLEEINDQTIAEAGGPDWKDYQETIEVPESFNVDFRIPQIVGTKPDAQYPEMPEDIRAEYEQAMKDNGLGVTDEDYAGFTEEQQEIEHELFVKMQNAYDERYPDTMEMPNQYENWWVDGPWEFTFDVTKDDSQTVVKEINDVDENGIGLVSVTKTPFEITVQDGQNYNTFTVVLDAEGELMDTGKFGGNTNVLAIGDHDVSKVDVYICDHDEYMDELKGYYWSEDYEEKKKEKTFKQLLDERALYHKEVSFAE